MQESFEQDIIIWVTAELLNVELQARVRFQFRLLYILSIYDLISKYYVDTINNTLVKKSSIAESTPLPSNPRLF